ncbi:two-component system VirA-like sensor kinase [Bradyrhizobium cenepequi]
MTPFRALTIVFALVLLLTWLSLRAINPEAERFDRALAELDRFAMLDAALYRDVFTARAGALRNYDPLVREINALHKSLDRLRQSAAIDADTSEAVGRLEASLARQEELVERFKSDNALLHNSLTFFERFSLHATAADLGPSISAAAAAMLQLTLDTSDSAVREVKDRLDKLADQARPFDGDVIGPLLAHGRLLQGLLPAVDGVLKAMRAIQPRLEQEQLRNLLLVRQNESRTMAREFRWLLYVTSLLLVAFLVHLGLRVRSHAKTLERRATFEHVIAGISMRFIDVLPENLDGEIERALADLMLCTGCDRTYVVWSGPAPRLYGWSRAGKDFPPGWPEGAPALAARFAPLVDGVVHVPNVNSLPVGQDRKALADVGLGAWACVTGVDQEGTSVALGFDTIGRPCRVTDLVELSLLRMALDIIMYAVGRHAMERERWRLEERLQQARRMERIGTFTSGIAHNFNNILGGILGHSEVIEEQLGQNNRFAQNLRAIRRGAERARDLVEQILLFGRHRDTRRRPLSAHSLVTEAVSLLNVSLPANVDLTIREPLATAIVSGEPAQLQQVILNLCNNAAQAIGDHGRIEIAMDIREITEARSLSHDTLQPGRYVCIVVTDTGRGMDEATLARIFEPFFTTRSSGNGLGLATVREIVHEHGGAMNVQSVPGKGSRFEVWLPCVAMAAPISDIKPAMLPVGKGETVLMVTSDQARLLRDEETLAAIGYEPVGFGTAAAACDACRAKPDRFDAAIVGYFGSAAASVEAAAALHAAAPHLPIVLAARSTEEIGADTLVTAGISDVVHWPLVTSEVAAALSNCSARKEPEAKPQVRSLRASHAEPSDPIAGSPSLSSRLRRPIGPRRKPRAKS